MTRIKLFLVLFLGCLDIIAQDTTVVVNRPKYSRKEEIIHDGKRYRIHNSYLTLGGGFLQSSIREKPQKAAAIDFHFPIKWSNFQVGAFMSGEEFGSNNNIQAHICYGLRKEKRHTNLAVYAGASYYSGVEGDTTSEARFYRGIGLYFSAQAVTKFAYDIGVGAELFGEISPKQAILGLKFLVFFSGAYRGP